MVPGRAPTCSAAPAAVERRARAAAPRRCLGSNQIGCASMCGPWPPELHGGVVLARHHVGVRDHHARCRPIQPLPSHPEAAGGARAPSPRCAPAARTCGSRAILAFGGADVRRRAVDLRERVEARERVEDRPRRRQRACSARAGSPSAGSACAARARPASGAPPRRRSRRARAPAHADQHGAADPVEHPERSGRAAGAAGSPSTSRPDGEHPADQERARSARTAARRASASPPPAAAARAASRGTRPPTKPASDSAPTISPCA